MVACGSSGMRLSYTGKMHEGVFVKLACFIQSL
jgi:hypothetical protein